MDTTKIRAFAVEAREKLLVGVDERLDAMGFAADGSVSEENRPVKVEGGVRFRGRVLDDPKFFEKWSKLETDIKAHKRSEVRNAVAYTWFNRFCAIRIMAKRGFIPVALEYVGNRESRTPALVASMRAGEPLPPLTGEERNALEAIRLDDTKTTDQFAILVSALCRNTPVIFKCFGAAVDYTSMLLPRDVLAPGGLIDVLNDPETISDDDYCADELIGWLYQYYISARKQEVFDSFKDGKKAEAEDIPAATQIFTPNWIVKYMVQNSLGRLAIENGLGGDFTKDWKYLIREEDGTHPPCLKVESPEELTMADVACGSGHILLEGFRHLLEIYAEAGYSRRKTVECILRKNLFGIDLDSRARQLSQFALMLAAMSVDPSFADARIMPCVLDMDGTLAEGDYHRAEIAEVLSVQDDVVINELQEAFGLMTQAHNLGSIMKFKISERTHGILSIRVAELEAEDQDERVAKYLPSFRLILGLTEKYAAMVTNPPYMGGKNMNLKLASYVKREYPNSKADLFAVFIELLISACAANGRIGMITMQSWMFLSSFEELRAKLLDENTILSMAHLGAHAFDAIGGEVTQATTFVLTNVFVPDYRGLYLRLVNGLSEAEKDCLFLKETGLTTYKPKTSFRVPSRDFKKIPGSPVAYWVSENTASCFERFGKLSDYTESSVGLQTGDNDKFIRMWWEIVFNNIKFDAHSSQDSYQEKRYFPYNKGGTYRKWHGNNECVVVWRNDGEEIIKNAEITGHHWQQYADHLKFRPMITWSRISSCNAAFRYKPHGFMSDMAGFSIYPRNALDLMMILGFGNSKPCSEFLTFMSPTLNFMLGQVISLPLCYCDVIRCRVNAVVAGILNISREDYKRSETSWDFSVNSLTSIYASIRSACQHSQSNPANLVNPVVNCGADGVRALPSRNVSGASDKSAFPLVALYAVVREKWAADCVEMRRLETENNRIFIEAYGLQDELTPDVPWNEITLICNPFYRYGVKELPSEVEGGENGAAGVRALPRVPELEERLRCDTIKELISYAVGCLMGRYSLEKEGLIIASQGETLEDYWKKVGRGSDGEGAVATQGFAPDEDGIIPLIAGANAFSDNGPQRVVDFIRAAFGAEHLNENLNFVEECLGGTIEGYMVKEFWKDHKKMYQNRPIYWLFSSKKGAFQCLVYLHRMDAYTASKVRNDYLLHHIEFLRNRIASETARSAELTAKERTVLKKMQQALDECLEYDSRLHVVADKMQQIDLDDGVLVNYAKFGDVLAKLK